MDRPAWLDVEDSLSPDEKADSVLATEQAWQHAGRVDTAQGREDSLSTEEKVRREAIRAMANQNVPMNLEQLDQWAALKAEDKARADENAAIEYAKMSVAGKIGDYVNRGTSAVYGMWDQSNKWGRGHRYLEAPPKRPEQPTGQTFRITNGGQSTDTDQPRRIRNSSGRPKAGWLGKLAGVAALAAVANGASAGDVESIHQNGGVGSAVGVQTTSFVPTFNQPMERPIVPEPAIKLMKAGLNPKFLQILDDICLGNTLSTEIDEQNSVVIEENMNKVLRVLANTRGDAGTYGLRTVTEYAIALHNMIKVGLVRLDIKITDMTIQFDVNVPRYVARSIKYLKDTEDTHLLQFTQFVSQDVVRDTLLDPGSKIRKLAGAYLNTAQPNILSIDYVELQAEFTRTMGRYNMGNHLDQLGTPKQGETPDDTAMSQVTSRAFDNSLTKDIKLAVQQELNRSLRPNDNLANLVSGIATVKLNTDLEPPAWQKTIKGMLSEAEYSQLDPALVQLFSNMVPLMPNRGFDNKVQLVQMINLLGSEEEMDTKMVAATMCVYTAAAENVSPTQLAAAKLCLFKLSVDQMTLPEKLDDNDKYKLNLWNSGLIGGTGWEPLLGREEEGIARLLYEPVLKPVPGGEKVFRDETTTMAGLLKHLRTHKIVDGADESTTATIAERLTYNLKDIDQVKMEEILKLKFAGKYGEYGDILATAVTKGVLEQWDSRDGNLQKAGLVVAGFLAVVGSMIGGCLQLAVLMRRKTASRKKGGKNMTLDDLSTIPTQAELGTLLVGITLTQPGGYHYYFTNIIANNYAKGIRNEMSQGELTEQKDKIWALWRDIGNRPKREKEMNDQIDQWIRADHSAASRAKRSKSPARAATK
jgi:hypothetical protein